MPLFAAESDAVAQAHGRCLDSLPEAEAHYDQQIANP